ncbi:hypothetical protein A5881_003622 [Enterococcus termitis]
MTKQNWFRLVQNGNRNQIILFPYAGGLGNSFEVFEKSQVFPKGTRVILLNMPGHGLNQEPLIDNIEDLLEQLYFKLVEKLDIPTVFFGYSMGGIVAHAMAKKLLPNKNISALIIAAANPPSVIHKQKISKRNIEKQVTHEVNKLLGKANIDIGNEFDSMFESLYSFYFPLLYADTNIYFSIEDSDYKSDIPTTVLYGDSDPNVQQDTVKFWENYYPNLTIVEMEGDHMFINNETNLKMFKNIFKSK